MSEPPPTQCPSNTECCSGVCRPLSSCNKVEVFGFTPCDSPIQSYVYQPDELGPGYCNVPACAPISLTAAPSPTARSPAACACRPAAAAANALPQPTSAQTWEALASFSCPAVSTLVMVRGPLISRRLSKRSQKGRGWVRTESPLRKCLVNRFLLLSLPGV